MHEHACSIGRGDRPAVAIAVARPPEICLRAGAVLEAHDRSRGTEQQRVGEQDALEQRPEHRGVEQRAAVLAFAHAIHEVHHGAGHVREMVQAPVDHQRREEELEQQRQRGQARGRRGRDAQWQLPGLACAPRGVRARLRAAQPRHGEPQALQEHECLGVQPWVPGVVRHQHDDVQRDERQHQRVHRQHRIDVEHAELPLRLQCAAMEAAGVGDHPVGEGDETQRR